MGVVALSGPLLHADGAGWDELVMVVGGLLLAWVVVSLTKSRSPTDTQNDEKAVGKE